MLHFDVGNVGYRCDFSFSS